MLRKFISSVSSLLTQEVNDILYNSLFGSGKAFIAARKLLLDECELKVVISMPGGVFKPYTWVATAILP